LEPDDDGGAAVGLEVLAVLDFELSDAGALVLVLDESLFAAALPESLADSLLDSLPDSLLDSDAPSLFVSALAPSSFFAAGAPLLPPRKSVTYQPEPFNWKPAAVTCLRKLSFPHCGHWVSGASLIFCSASFWKPQDSQRYA
jgi:hypothetical protein